MVILVGKLGRSLKFPIRLDNPCHDSEALSASFRVFRSDVSKFLSQILLEAKPGSEFLSLEWTVKCFELIPMINKAFAKLVVDIDYSMCKWEAAAAEDYMNYSLNILDLLNKVSSSLSHLGQARLALSHALSLFENSPSSASKHLQPIQPNDLGKHLKLEGGKENEEKHGSSGKELIIREALLIVKSTGIWLFGIIISGLCSDGKAYIEMRKSACKLQDSSVKSLDLILSEEMTENRCIMKEVKEVNDAATMLVEAIARPKRPAAAAAAAKGLSIRLKVFESLIDGLRKQTESQFSEVLAARNKLLDTIRHKHKF